MGWGLIGAGGAGGFGLDFLQQGRIGVGVFFFLVSENFFY